MEALKTPKFTNLEIRADWDGNPRHSVDIRMSLEVESAPNTQLHLLDLRSPSIAFEKAFAYRLGYDASKRGAQSAWSWPDTPTVESPPAADVSGEDHKDEMESPCNRAGNKLFPLRRVSALDESDSSVVPGKPSFSSSTLDSLDTDRQRTGGEVSTCASAIQSQVDWLFEAANIALPQSLDSSIHEGSDAESCSANSMLLELNIRIPKRGERNSKQRLGKRSAKEAGLADPGSDSPKTTSSITALQSHLPIRPIKARKGMTPYPIKIGTAITKPTFGGSSPVVEDTYDNKMIGRLDDKDISGSSQFMIPRSPAVVVEPEIFLADGQLSLRNPMNVAPGTYKVMITVSVTLSSKRPKRWHDLVLSGLPRSNIADSGFFLFQIPEDMGMEFRTTSLRRHETIENCFCAEFTGDLILPFRICDSKYYGTVRSFTVDYEIRADSMPIIRDSCSGISSLSVKYHAVCSLHIHNLCFMSRNCSFFIHIEGGPQGSFRCKLKPQQLGPAIIHLETDKCHPIGSSHVQVICPPRHLEMFIVTWDVDLRSSTWLPRIYPALSEPYDRKGDDYLRNQLAEPAVRHNSTGDDIWLPEFATYPEGGDMGPRVPPVSPLLTEPYLKFKSSGLKLIIIAVIAVFLVFGLDQVQDMENRQQKMYWPVIPHFFRGDEQKLGSYIAKLLRKECIPKYFSRDIQEPAEIILNKDQAHRSCDDGMRGMRYQKHRIDPHGDDDDIFEQGKGSLKDMMKSTLAFDIVNGHTPSHVVYGDLSMHSDSRISPRLSTSQDLEALSFRDRVDYLLGWKGPVDR